jgi:hypothetical protein
LDRTRNSTVWIDIDEWLLLDILKTEGFEFIGKAEFFHDKDDLKSHRISLMLTRPRQFRKSTTFQGLGLEVEQKLANL